MSRRRQIKKMLLRDYKICLVSLGCPKNQVDSEVALGILKMAGCKLQTDPKTADVLIINTCAFIRAAEEETIRAVLEAARWKDAGRMRFLLVAGCWVSKYGGQRLRNNIPQIDATAKPGDAREWIRCICRGLGIPAFEQEAGRFLLSGPGSAYLKIAEGCSRRCTFCLIPTLRGPLQSRPPDDVFREAQALARAGVRELILVAQDSTRYGCDLYAGRPALAALLRRLAKVPEVEWIRVMYANPDGLDEELITLLAEEKKICPYLDMPLQHAHPAVLRAMGRTGGAKKFMALIARLRSRIPDLVLRTTILTGFPGETEAEHQTVLHFIRDAQFDRLGVFTFSREDGTRAARLPRQVHPQVKQRRYRELMAAQAEVSRRRLTRWVGTIQECLIEEPSGRRHVLGRTRGDAPEIDGAVVLQGNARPGAIVRARITGSTDHDLQGVVLSTCGGRSKR
ncbi:30S ribosomal protein S12 methylthiotransferase RimO [candidate division FCPU426 bacterium]|nr:30S ribosomal protein S12 methylthiotransferase RimO [candidate division FCPU426 bacterium]